MALDQTYIVNNLQPIYIYIYIYIYRSYIRACFQLVAFVGEHMLHLITSKFQTTQPQKSSRHTQTEKKK